MSDKFGEWIPVGERLPREIDEPHSTTEAAIIYSPSHGMATGFYDFYRNGWVVLEWKSSEMYFDVTHWMPLPPPPIKEGEKS